jgi:hypothetical protein
MNVAKLGQTQKLAKGGTAIIYRVPEIDLGLGPLVYKEYLDETRERAGKEALTAGLRRFVRFREKLALPQKKLWDARIVWPVAVVIGADDEAAGVLMPLIPAAYFHDFPKIAGGVENEPLDIEKLFGAPDDRPAKYLPPMSVSDRLALVSGVAHAYGLMHRMKVVLGDVSGRNVVFNPKVSPPVALVVDVDSARIEGNRAVGGSQAHTPGWEPPETLAAARRLRQLQHTGGSEDQIRRAKNDWSIQNKATDVYKMGLMVTRLLDNRRRGSVNRDPGKAIGVLRRAGFEGAARLLARSLDDDPETRPTMREWYEALGGSRRSGVRDGSSSSGQARTDDIPESSSSGGQARTNGIPEGTRKGAWVWQEGTGWVRAAPPVKAPPARRGRSPLGGRG